MKKLQVGKHQILVDDDFELKTGLTIVVDNKGYAKINKYHGVKPNGKPNNKYYMMLHSYIMNSREQIDHIDRNPLNNQRSNLRFCTHSQNQANKNKKAKGYSYNTNRKKYIARIQINNKQIYIGGYNTQEEAHKAYTIKKRELFGEFANE